LRILGYIRAGLGKSNWTETKPKPNRPLSHWFPTEWLLHLLIRSRLPSHNNQNYGIATTGVVGARRSARAAPETLAIDW